MRYALIRYNTDFRHPSSSVHFTYSKNRAIEFLSEERPLLIPGHRFVRCVHIIPKGWRKPSKKRLETMAFKSTTSTYFRNSIDILASILLQFESFDPFQEIESIMAS
jgi:hypothetical protein